MTKSERCIYCLDEFEDEKITVDHVIARSWYPVHTQNIQKWTAPSCKECNNKLSAVEDTVLTRLALCLDPNDPMFGSLAKKGFRAFDPKQSKSYRDTMHRFNRKQALLRGISKIDSPTDQGVLPSFRGNYNKGSRIGISIPSIQVNTLIEKWIRGVHYCELGDIVPKEAIVEVYFVEDNVAIEAYKDILQYAKRIRKGPGVEVLIVNAKEGDYSISQFAFNIWDEFRAYGSVEIDHSKIGK